MKILNNNTLLLDCEYLCKLIFFKNIDLKKKFISLALNMIINDFIFNLSYVCSRTFHHV